VLIDFPNAETVTACAAHLASSGVLVRRFGAGAHAAQMRISIGASQAIERATDLITEFLS
jgi:histidinol-phosphate/aromatic aminotransferase/cobyric acid decarboxylase-like protein